MAALLLAFLVRLAVPQGFMLSQAGDLAFVPCPSATMTLGASPSALHLSDHHGDHAQHAPLREEEPDPASSGHARCPYAALAAPVLPPAPPLLVGAEPIATQEQPGRSLAASPAPSLASPPPPSRGPPLLS